ncbi:MAG TPA: NAD(P)-dependent alcohol dehydrogenase, partial [Methanocella sp.]|nr:NAD(P)-dependent alcohol dehydrogenase [Methanocella sp.]
MKAIVCTRYGPPEVLRLEDVKKPAPGDDALVIKVHATTVAAGDLELRKFKFPLWLWLPARIGFGIRGPRSKILGQELAGEVETVGKEVSLFRQGDRIFGITGFGFGAYAEYICLPENPRGGVLVVMPAGVSYGEAASIPLGGLEALHFLRKGNVRKGEKVLINGAGGSIGTLA